MYEFASSTSNPKCSKIGIADVREIDSLRDVHVKVGVEAEDVGANSVVCRGAC